jgi:hypothetical protein
MPGNQIGLSPGIGAPSPAAVPSPGFTPLQQIQQLQQLQQLQQQQQQQPFMGSAQQQGYGNMQQEMMQAPPLFQQAMRYNRYFMQRVTTNVAHVLFYVVDTQGMAKLAVVVGTTCSQDTCMSSNHLALLVQHVFFFAW